MPQTTNKFSFQFYAICIAVLIGVFFGGFDLGQVKKAEIKQALDRQQETSQNIHDENEELSRKINRLDVEITLLKEQLDMANLSTQEALDEGDRLRQELTFYKKVMAPELQQKGFDISEFAIRKTSLANVYRFELTLLQLEKIKNTVKGKLNIDVSGSENGQTKSYKLAALLVEERPLEYSFKYFQIVEGKIALPDGFIPERIEVSTSIYQFKRKRGDLSKAFDWQMAE